MMRIYNYKEVEKLINKKIKELEEEYKTVIKLTKILEIPPLNYKNKKVIEDKQTLYDYLFKNNSFLGIRVIRACK